jgi:hypothetical protein
MKRIIKYFKSKKTLLKEVDNLKREVFSLSYSLRGAEERARHFKGRLLGQVKLTEKAKEHKSKDLLRDAIGKALDKLLDV